MPINSRAKGQRGEREVIDMLQPIVDMVTYELGMETLLLQRNTIQSHKGGYDIIGLPWFAPEVKWCEVLDVKGWWKQCRSQAKSGQVPVLFYKSNGKGWNVVMYGGIGQDDVWTDATCTVDMDKFKVWFRLKLEHELKS